MKPPKEMGLSKDELLLVIGPLYGIPESGLHWFLTYQPHHISKLDRKSSKLDQCVLYRRKNENLKRLKIMQVDDTFGNGTKEFLEQEDIQSKKF